MTPNWGDQSICSKAGLPSRGIWTGWKNRPTVNLWKSIRASAKSYPSEERMAGSDAGWGRTGGGAALLKRSWGQWQTVSGTRGECALSERRPMASWVVSTAAWPVGWGKWWSPFTQRSLSHIEILHSVLGGPTKKQRFFFNWSKFSRRLLRWSDTGGLEERMGNGILFRLERRQLWGHLTADPQYLWGGHREEGVKLFTTVRGGRRRYNRHELKQERFRLHIRENFSPQEQSDSSTGLCRFHPWGFSRPDWMKPWAIWADLMAQPSLRRWLDPCRSF